MKIQYNVSDIASLTGYNKYKTNNDILDLVIGYFYRSYPEMKSLNNFVSSKDEIKSNFDKLSVDDKKSINTLMETDMSDTKILNASFKKVSSIINKSEHINMELDKKTLINYISGENNKKYGTQNESKTIDKYKTLTTNVITNNNDQLYLYETDKYITRGRIDGFCEVDGKKHLVEIKNRKNRIFNFIPIYERIQLYYYMKSCNIEDVLFIQMLDEEIDETIIDEIEEDIFIEADDRLNTLSELINKLSTDAELRDSIIDKKNIDTLSDYIYWI